MAIRPRMLNFLDRFATLGWRVPGVFPNLTGYHSCTLSGGVTGMGVLDEPSN